VKKQKYYIHVYYVHSYHFYVKYMTNANKQSNYLLICLPCKLARCAEINVLDVCIIVSDVDDFTFCILGICRTFWVWTWDMVDARECGVELSIFIDDM